MSSILESEEVQIEQSEEQVKLPASLPVLPLRDIVIFPYMIVPLFVQRERSIRAVDQALAENRMIMLVSQRDPLCYIRFELTVRCELFEDCVDLSSHGVAPIWSGVGVEGHVAGVQRQHTSRGKE